MKISILAGVLVLGAAGVASAAETSAFDWSGAYAGVHIGYGQGDADYVDSEYNGAPPYPTVRWGAEADGLLGGVQIGHNWRNDNVVLGLEGELGYYNLKGSAIQPGTDPFNLPYDGVGGVGGGFYGALSVRVGYVFDETLVYARAGALYSDAEVRFYDTCVTAPCGDGVVRMSEPAGWAAQIGLGVERPLNDAWTLRGEYSWADFGEATMTGRGVAGGAAGVTYDVRGALTLQTLKLGVNRRF